MFQCRVWKGLILQCGMWFWCCWVCGSLWPEPLLVMIQRPSPLMGAEGSLSLAPSTTPEAPLRYKYMFSPEMYFGFQPFVCSKFHLFYSCNELQRGLCLILDVDHQFHSSENLRTFILLVLLLKTCHCFLLVGKKILPCPIFITVLFSLGYVRTDVLELKKFSFMFW